MKLSILIFVGTKVLVLNFFGTQVLVLNFVGTQVLVLIFFGIYSKLRGILLQSRRWLAINVTSI